MSDTLTRPAEHEALIKRSRFIARAAACRDEGAASRFLERVSDPSANHNCWAWRLGMRYRFDDDGEPGGTAGRPILQAIEHQDMDQIVVVVTRYFGGIKLGTGGLARAYGSTAAECLRTADRTPLIVTTRLQLLLPFEHVATAHQLMAQYGASKLEEDYSSSGVRFLLELANDHKSALETALNDATRGAARLEQD